MIPFPLDRNWYQTYWLDEGSGSVQTPLLRALIEIISWRHSRGLSDSRLKGLMERPCVSKISAIVTASLSAAGALVLAAISSSNESHRPK